MKVYKVIILSTIFLSSIISAGEKNPNRLSTLCTKVLATNPDRTKSMKFNDSFCRDQVTNICENSELPLDEKIPAVAFWKKQNGLTKKGKKQIKAVEKILQKAKEYRDRPTPQYVDIDGVDFCNPSSIDLDALFYAAVNRGNFKPNLALFVVNQTGSQQIAQDPNNLNFAIRHSKEPSKAVQFLLKNGAALRRKKLVWSPIFGSSVKTETALNVAQEQANQALISRNFIPELYATQEEYNKTIKILEKAEQEEIYSDIQRLFQ